MEGAAQGITEGEVCPDEEKSAQIGPLAAVWSPNPAPQGQRLASLYRDPACLAIVGGDSKRHLGNVD